ncbi:MAG: glycoside hydrolase, partial [Burkholderiales bacterium]|nr:glycoside hydrolase [Opitutaceae bacterium]
RFALRAHGAYDQVAAMRFALEHQNPLVAAPVITKSAGVYPETHYSLITVDNPSALLWAVKPAEEGIDHGIIARLWNVSDSPATALVTLAPGLASARRTTHVETDLEPVPLTEQAALPATFTKQQMRTYRLLTP